MSITFDWGFTRLAKDTLLRLRDAQGKAIAVFDGMVWITQEGDPDDVFVRAGQTFTFARRGLVIVEAIEDSRVSVLDADTPTGPAAHEAAPLSYGLRHRARRNRSVALADS
jgi:Protein of unknown function (DUF2917)